MRAVVYHGKHDVRVDNVNDPIIKDPTDIIIRITSTALCGSDLHLFDGFVPTMKSGDIVGHEPMGEVVEVGSEVKRLRKGDRVVVPFTISCGSCYFCEKTLYSLCDTTNPHAEMAAGIMGHSPAGVFGYSQMLGGFDGGQAEYLRVPHADVGPLKVPDGMPDDQVLFLSDILPTAWMAAENAGIQPGDTVAIWGCGPVGLLTIKCAWLMGAGRVVAIDRVAARLAMARNVCGAETINYAEEDTYERLQQMTSGMGPSACIDAVGAESHHSSGLVRTLVDKAKEAVSLLGDRPHALNEAIRCCRKGGTLSVPGVYGSMMEVLFGAVMNKALTIKTGQTHVQRYMKPLLERIQAGELDPSFIITHRLPLSQAPEAYKMFRDKQDGCIKVVFKP